MQDLSIVLLPKQNSAQCEGLEVWLNEPHGLVIKFPHF